MAEEKTEKIKVKKEKVKKERPVKEKKSEKKEVQAPKIFVPKKPVVRQRQRAMMNKKSKLAVKARQTKWAPVWVVIRKYGVGKRIHPSATTAYRRSWRRTKLRIKPRRMRKWHMG